MKALRWLALALGGVAAILGLVALTARLSDGPIGPFQGGALVAGALVDKAIADWGFLESVGQIEMQLLDPPRSRTTWVVVEGGRAFIPCGLPNFRLLKQWPHQALEDGRALIRHEGRRYAVRLVKTEDPALEAALGERVSAKYGTPAGEGPEVWFFELHPRGGFADE